MAKSKAQIQQEYNEALKVSQSLTGALNKMIDDTAKGQKRITDAQKRYNEGLKNIVDSATDVESTEEAILALEKKKEGVAKRYWGANAKLVPQKKAEIQASIDILKSESKRLQLVNQVDDAAQDLANTINGSLDGLLNGVGEIPVLGKAFSGLAKGPVNYLKGSFSNAAQVFTTKFSAATASGMGGMKAFASAGGASMKSLAGALIGPQAIIAAIVAAALAGVIAFYKIEKAAKAFRNETGLLNSQTQQTEQNINRVYQSTVGLGASMEDVAQAAADFTNEFGGIEQPMESTMQSMVVLSKNFGVSTKDAAAVNKAFQNMSGLSESAAQSQVMFTAELAKATGVAPTQVMADIAESANDAGGFFRGNTKEMIKTAAYARAMGSSLKEVAAISRGLLDYQSSVTNEMEASAILGTNLNFSQSRYLAAQGDILGAQKSMVEQLRNTVDLENASIYEREALEKATGMQFDQIQNMARIQERFGDLDGERLAAAQALVKAGKDAKTLTEDDLKAQIKAMETQKETQGVMESIGNSFSAIGNKLLQAFLPIGQAIASMLEDAMPYFDMMGNVLAQNVKPVVTVISTLFKGIGKFIGAMMDALKPGFQAIQKALQPIKNLFKELFSTQGESGKFMKGLMGAFSFVGNIVGKVIGVAFTAISKVIEFIATTFTSIADFFKGDIGFGELVTNILSGLVNAIGGVVDTLVTALWEGFKSVFSSLGTYIAKIIRNVIGDKAGDWIGLPEAAAGGVVTSATPLIAGEAGAEAIVPLDKYNFDNESGVTAKGGIGESMAPSISSMDSVVSELKELKLAFLSNKDVYIDNQKVTSRITKTQERSSVNQFGLMGA